MEIGDLSNWDTSSLIACSDMFTVYGELNPNIDKKVYSWYEEFLKKLLKCKRTWIKLRITNAIYLIINPYISNDFDLKKLKNAINKGALR